MKDNHINKLRSVKEKLNAVGKGFCLQKWRHETLYLHTGDNHSCYHPRPNKAPLEEIKVDVSALHNTKWKKEQRKAMLEGNRPDECYYCWNIEDLTGEHFSDRAIHNSSEWLLDIDKEIELIKNQPWDTNYNPYYLEMSFSNNCNFKCGYCCPQSSTLWIEEIKKNGNYNLTYNQYGIEFLDSGSYYPDDENNPYVTAFWEWWPSLRKDLKVLRLTGGEALMHPSTFKLLDKLEEEPAPDLILIINSNLGVATSRVERIMTQVKKLLDLGKIKAFKMFTSIDSWGEQAEYMRRGLDCKLWETNLNTVLTLLPNSEIGFMITYNVLCVAYFRPLLEKILELRAKYSVNNRQRITFDTPYLKEPPHWMINILPKDSFSKYLEDDLEFMKANCQSDNYDPTKFANVEIEKFKRVMDYFNEGGSKITEDLITRGRRDFHVFFTEYDQRSKLDLIKTFPLYESFAKLCKETYETYERNPIN
jgi:organic radical activating enzyme